MLRALYSASSGMLTQQMNMDLMANNISNVNTIGYKKSRADFADLLYSTLREQNTVAKRGGVLPNAIQTGNGVRLAATKNILTDGNLQVTGNGTDLAIEGEGFFQVQMADGTTAYTRNGSFQLDSAGNLMSADGYSVQPAIKIPQGSKELTIASDGTVSAMVPGYNTPQNLGQIQLAKFINSAGLQKIGSSLYKTSDNSGPAQLGFGNMTGFGVVRQGYLEMSNVNVAEEMVNVMITQRAYELNSKAVKNADEMLGIANGLLRR